MPSMDMLIRMYSSDFYFELSFSFIIILKEGAYWYDMVEVNLYIFYEYTDTEVHVGLRTAPNMWPSQGLADVNLMGPCKKDYFMFEFFIR